MWKELENETHLKEMYKYVAEAVLDIKRSELCFCGKKRSKVP